MIEVREPVERVILVGVPLRHTPTQVVDEHLEELARLAQTAGANVVGSVIQRVESPHPSLYIGTGKAKQLRRLAEELEATLVIFDEDLSPAQGSSLEEELKVRVMDRTELILDIFALRARTAEARLQVELAQLQYMRPRLKRLWTHLSRISGGIGARGPGEQQLETDRRLIDRRISRLRRQLKHISRSRDTRRKARRGEFQVALVGYTNAGKSSILRALSGSELLVEDRLFATLDSATRVVELSDGRRALVTDTVGFIRKLPHHLVASFRGTLEEVREADLLLHVIDASASNWRQRMQVVADVLDEVGAGGRRMVLVFHKADRLTHAEEEALRNRCAAFLGPYVVTSVREPGGLDSLRALLRTEVLALLRMVRITFPAADGRTLAEAYREGEVLSREVTNERVVLTARLPEAVIGRWKEQRGVELSYLDAPDGVRPLPQPS